MMTRGNLLDSLLACKLLAGRNEKSDAAFRGETIGRSFTAVLAGGGVRGGHVYGSSDAIAGQPKDNPVHASDFVATIYHALGYDASTKVVDQLGRPQHVVKGQPVLAMF